MAHEKAFDGVPTLRDFIAFVYERSFEPCVLEACNEVMLAMGAMMVCDVYGCDEKAVMRVLNRGTGVEVDMCDLHGDLYGQYEMMDVIAWYEKAS